MKIIGYSRSDFATKDGTKVTGYNVWLGRPVSGKDAAGQAVERIYISDRRLAESDFSLKVGADIGISYNKFGKLTHIFSID